MQLRAVPGMEQLENRALMTAVFEVPAIVEPAIATSANVVDAPMTDLEANPSRREARGTHERRRTRFDTVELVGVITSESGSLNGNLGLSIDRRGKTTGLFATAGAYGTFLVSGWTVDGPVLTFHGGNQGRKYPIPVQGYNRLDTLVQMTIDKTSGIVQGTLQATVYGKRVHPLVIAPVVFTGTVIATP